MAEFESCSKCKFDGKAPTEEPCSNCIHNAMDNFKPKSNADRIREMSDEELAEWIFRHDVITYSHGRLNTEQLLEWLKSEVKE